MLCPGHHEGDHAMNPTSRTYTIQEIRALSLEEMLEVLNIHPTKHTYLYRDRERRLSAIEKPSPDSAPDDLDYAIGYVRKLRGL